MNDRMRQSAVVPPREIVIRLLNPTEPAKWDMTPEKLLANFKPTYTALNNVESRAGIAQPQGAAFSGSTFAIQATASAMSAPIETGDLL
jgi:hypothetical protein